MKSKSKSSIEQKELFKTKIVPGKPGSGELFEEEYVANESSVECLGMTFENDEKRREYFLEKLRDKLNDPEFRKIEGFPIGEDEDILALSDPPYYTACPNPFIEDFIEHFGKPYDPSVPYSREPFAEDVKANKRHAFYIAHSYHTKVPHEAIVRYVMHYTEPGDVILDGFSGSGMTGLGALACERPEPCLKANVDKEFAAAGVAPSWGHRTTILVDLSPMAAFMGHNYTTHRSAEIFEHTAKNILSDLDEQYSWFYSTMLDATSSVRKVANYYVWSDVFLCPQCGDNIQFWRDCVDQNTGEIASTFRCPSCSSELSKRSLELASTSHFDELLNKAVSRSRKIPVMVNVLDGHSKSMRDILADDIELLDRIESEAINDWVPIMRMPEGEESRRNDKFGVTHVHHYFTKRNLLVLAKLFALIRKAPPSIRLPLLFMATSTFRVLTIRSLFLPSAYFRGGTGPFKPCSSGTLYIPSLTGERNVVLAWKERISQFSSLFGAIPRSIVPPICSAQSSGDLRQMPDSSIDYVFVDPPFGRNIMYSELNVLWEAWLRVQTNAEPEAIENSVQAKGLLDYEHLMQNCFEEFYRVLKPGRWMTVIFHNSSNAVWNALQTAIQQSGFIVADVSTLDRKQGTFVQYTAASSVKQDLVISAYKPNGGLEERFGHEAGTEEGVWDFVRTHLKQLPVFVSKNGQAEIIAERQNYLLFDRMVAFHVQRSVAVPMSAAEFYAGLEQRFPPRDGMYFLSDQAAEYDKKRMTVKEVLQLELFVSDEASAIQWLKQQFTRKPQTFQDIHPQFLKEIGGWQKHEKALELSELLEQNFLRYDGKGEVPSQIHSYLSTNFKELRNLEKGDPALKAKAKDRWYVPDPNKAGDLEKLRERALMREFEEYRESKQKRLKVFRLEAVRAGFKKAWQERDYTTIIAVASKIPENILQEDPKLLMWYDQALTRSGEE